MTNEDRELGEEELEVAAGGGSFLKNTQSAAQRLMSKDRMSDKDLEGVNGGLHLPKPNVSRDRITPAESTE